MKGILFTPENIQAIIEGRKTVTRRAINPQPNCQCEGNHWKGELIDWIGYKHEGKTSFFCHKCGSGLRPIDECSVHGILPHYNAGETVYIKEVHYRYGHWELTGNLTKSGIQEWRFVAETDEVLFKENKPDIVCRSGIRYSGWHKRSPLFLPAEDACHFRKILDVRLERLQEITADDCLKEGCKPDYESFYKATEGCEGWEEPEYFAEECEDECDWINCGHDLVHSRKHRQWLRDKFNYALELSYQKLWDSINPNLPFEINPWVFRYKLEG